MDNILNLYIVFTPKVCPRASVCPPPEPIAKITAGSRVAAQAALFAAFKDGELDLEFDIEDYQIFEISNLTRLRGI